MPRGAGSRDYQPAGGNETYFLSDLERPEQTGQRRCGKNNEEQASPQDVAPELVHGEMASKDGCDKQEPPVPQCPQNVALTESPSGDEASDDGRE